MSERIADLLGEAVGVSGATSDLPVLGMGFTTREGTVAQEDVGEIDVRELSIEK